MKKKILLLCFLLFTVSFELDASQKFFAPASEKVLHIYYTYGLNQVFTSANRDIGYVKTLFSRHQKEYHEYSCPVLRYKNYILFDLPKNLKNTDLPFSYQYIEKSFVPTFSSELLYSPDTIMLSSSQNISLLNDFFEDVQNEIFDPYPANSLKKIKGSVGKISTSFGYLAAIRIDEHDVLDQGPSPWEIQSGRCVDSKNSKFSRIFVIPHQYGGAEKKVAFFSTIPSDDTLTINLGGWGNDDGLHALFEQPNLFDVLLLEKELFGTDFFFSPKPTIEHKLLSSNFSMPENKILNFDEPGILPFLSRWMHEHPVFVRQLPKHNLPKPWVIINKNHVRIAVFGITDPKTKRETDFDNGLSFDISNSVENLQQIIRQIRPYADLVMVISNADNTINQDYQSQLKDVDIFLGNTAHIYTPITTATMYQDSKPSPLFAPEIPMYSAAGHLEIKLSRSNSDKFALKQIDHSIVLFDDSLSPPTSRFLSLETQKTHFLPEFVLPPAKDIPTPNDFISEDTSITATIALDNANLRNYENHYSDKEFFQLVTNLMLKYTKAELSIGNPYKRDGTITSYVDAAQSKSWFKPYDEVILIHCRGQYLRELLKKIEGIYPYAGFPIDFLLDYETYSVAVSTFFMNDQSSFGTLQMCYIDDSFKRTSMGDFVTESLLQLKSNTKFGFSKSSPEYETYLSELSPLVKKRYIKRDPQWRIVFKDLSISFHQSLYKNQEEFSKVSNDKINGNAQETLGGSYNIQSLTPVDNYLFELGSKANYTTTKIKDPVFGKLSNNLEDDLRLLGQAAYFLFHFSELSWVQAAGLAVQIEYDTEFTPTDNQLHQQILRFVPGVKLSEGNTVKDVLLGAVFQYDLAQKQRIFPKPGFNISSEIEKNLSDFLQYKGNIEFRYLPDHDHFNDAELYFELGIDSSFLIKVSPSLAVAPTLNFYMYKGEQTQKTGFYSLFGVAFGYSKTWKPYIHPLYR